MSRSATSTHSAASSAGGRSRGSQSPVAVLVPNPLVPSLLRWQLACPTAPCASSGSPGFRGGATGLPFVRLPGGEAGNAGKAPAAAELILKIHLELQRQDYAAFLQKKGFLPPFPLVFSGFSPSEGYPWPLLFPPAAPLPFPAYPGRWLQPWSCSPACYDVTH